MDSLMDPIEKYTLFVMHYRRMAYRSYPKPICFIVVDATDGTHAIYATVDQIPEMLHRLKLLADRVLSVEKLRTCIRKLRQVAQHFNVRLE